MNPTLFTSRNSLPPKGAQFGFAALREAFRRQGAKK